MRGCGLKLPANARRNHARQSSPDVAFEKWSSVRRMLKFIKEQFGLRPTRMVIRSRRKYPLLPGPGDPSGQSLTLVPTPRYFPSGNNILHTRERVARPPTQRPQRIPGDKHFDTGRSVADVRGSRCSAWRTGQGKIPLPHPRPGAAAGPATESSAPSLPADSSEVRVGIEN